MRRSKATITPTMMRIFFCFFRVRRRPFGFLLLVLLFLLVVGALLVLERLVLVRLVLVFLAPAFLVLGLFLLALALLVLAFLVPVRLVLPLLLRAMVPSSERFTVLYIKAAEGCQIIQGLALV